MKLIARIFATVKYQRKVEWFDNSQDTFNVKCIAKLYPIVRSLGPGDALWIPWQQCALLHLQTCQSAVATILHLVTLASLSPSSGWKEDLCREWRVEFSNFGIINNPACFHKDPWLCFTFLMLSYFCSSSKSLLETIFSTQKWSILPIFCIFFVRSCILLNFFLCIIIDVHRSHKWRSVLKRQRGEERCRGSGYRLEFR